MFGGASGDSAHERGSGGVPGGLCAGFPRLGRRQDFFLARRFRDLDDLNCQFDRWRTTSANLRTHATTGRVVDEAFAAERRN